MKIRIKWGDNFETIHEKQMGEGVSQTPYTTENIVSLIAKETGIMEDDVRRLLLFIRFALWKKASMTKTKFAKDFGIMNPMDLYEWIKETKYLLKNDREKEGFDRIRRLMNSAGSVAGAWFFDTWIKYMDDISDKEKYIRATKYGDAFIIKTLGIYMDNLIPLRKIMNKLSKYQDVLFEYAQGERASGQEVSVDTEDTNG